MKPGAILRRLEDVLTGRRLFAAGSSLTAETRAAREAEVRLMLAHARWLSAFRPAGNDAPGAA